MRYVTTYGGNYDVIERFWETLEDAKVYAEEVFRLTGTIVGIEEI